MFRSAATAAAAVAVTLLAGMSPLVVAPTPAGAAPAKGRLAIETATLPAPVAGASYQKPLVAKGGVPPYHWSVVGGKLPKGLALSDAGLISGNPQTSGTASFSVEVTDSAQPVAATAERALALDVGPQQIYVVNAGADSVTQYGLPVSGDVPPVATIAGSATALDNPGAIAVGPDGAVYVVDDNTDSIDVYASGTTTQGPIRQISGFDTGLSAPSEIALDSHDDLYVADRGANAVMEYRPDANGDAQPIATISGAGTGFSDVNGIAIDPAGDIVVGAGEGAIEFFPPGADGDFAPTRTLAGDDTDIAFPIALQYDGQGDLYVLSVSQDPAAVLEFAPGAQGDATPTRFIYGPNTTLVQGEALAVDDSGRVYVANESSNRATSSVVVFAAGARGDAAPAATLEGSATALSLPSGIAISSPLFVRTPALPVGEVGSPYSQKLAASLGVAPYHWRIFTGALPKGLRLTATGVIKGTPTADGIGSFTVAVTDAAVPNPTTAFAAFTINVGVAEFVYVANSTVGDGAITVYEPSPNSDTPVASISGPDTGLAQPQGLAFDATARLYVANYEDSVTEYAPDAFGDSAPVATISGSNTGLFTPAAVAIDAQGRVFVANELAGTVTEYAPGAQGNVAPTATITGLDDPVALSFDPAGRLWVNSGDTLEAFTEGQSGAATPVATLAGPDTGLSGVKGFAFDSDGWLHVSDVNSSAVTTYEPGAVNDAAPFSTFSVSVPWGDAVDADGHAFVVQDSGAGAVFTASRFGTDVQTVAQGAAAGFAQPTGVAVSPAGSSAPS